MTMQEVLRNAVLPVGRQVGISNPCGNSNIKENPNGKEKYKRNHN